MKIIILPFLFMTLCVDAHSQQAITNIGQLQIHNGAAIIFHGNFTNASSAILVNNGTLFAKKNISNTQSSMSAGTGTLHLNGTTMQAMNGTQPFKTFHLTTNNASGVHLNNDLTISGTHTFQAGMITTANTPEYLVYEAGASYTGSNEASHVNGWVQKNGNTDFVFPVGSATQQRSIGIANLSSTSSFSIKYDATTPNFTQLLPPIAVVNRQEYWTVNKLAGGTATVSMNWNHSQVPFNAWRISDIVAANFDGSNWSAQGGTATGDVYTTGSITSNSAASFGLFAIASKTTSLPLTLLSFDAKRLNDHTQLYWKTDNEQNVAYFLVQRSDDGIHYTNIYEQPARNTGAVEYYSAKDQKAISTVAYYRLLTVEGNGIEKLSQVVKISLSGLNNGLSLLLNPVKEKLSLMAANEVMGAFHYTILGVNGQLIQKGDLQISRNAKCEVVLKADMKPGTYTISVSNSAQSFILRFVKQ